MTNTDLMKQLLPRAERLADLTGVMSLLSWDQETMMPSGGTETRAHQLGTLARLIHEGYAEPELGDLLRRLSEELGDSVSSDEAGIVRAMLRQHDQRTKIPAELVVRRSELSTRAREAWKAARKQNDFKAFAPFLTEQFQLSRELAGHLGHEANPYDALLDQFEPGTSFDWINSRFSGMKPALGSLIARIAEAKKGDSSHDEVARVTHRRVAPDVQLEFSRRMAEAVGFEFHHGRMDLSAHPFTSGASPLDVRFTTRIEETYFPSCLFAVIHEAGHGIHGQKLKGALRRFPFRYGLAIAESQSRFYENIVGRGREFWERHFADLQSAVPEFADVSIDSWYRAINNVHPSLIRVEADEVTYGMHIMLRFELENLVINDELRIEDLPSAWNSGMKEFLGVEPDSDSNGVLQDIHWSQGGIGYFPDYLLGSMLSSQLWEALTAVLPDARDRIRRGEMHQINGWMADTVQSEGGKYTFAEMAEHATGREFSSEPYVEYLRGKFGPIYGLA